MLIHDKKKLGLFLQALKNDIELKKSSLFALNKEITKDVDSFIQDDYKTLMTYLDDFVQNCKSTTVKIKPKGKVLLMLSHNEPFILSVIPVLNALVTGNSVIVRPSSGSIDFFEIIWSDSLMVEYNLSLEKCSVGYSQVETIIKEVNAVYFFGSFNNAKKIATICGKNYVEFHPEIETTDVKVYACNEGVIRDDVRATLRESFTHSGQTCQRIQGIFVNNLVFKEYVSVIKKEMKTLKKEDFVSNDFLISNKIEIELFNKTILESSGRSIGGRGIPSVLILPSSTGENLTDSFFLPTLWVTGYDSVEGLIDLLNNRQFYLGLNIQSDDRGFVKKLISQTKFSRYTINTTHTNVRSYEGWGGVYPSGFSGYHSWVEQFTNPFVVIVD